MIAFLTALLSLAAQDSGASPPACSATGSIRTTVAEIAGDPRRFVGRCVTVTAASSGRSLFHDIDAIYLGALPAPFDHAQGEHGRIGLDVADDRTDLLALAHRGPLHLTATGIVDTCEDRLARARTAFERRREPDAIFIPSLGGYCHWFGGPVIKASEYSFDETARYERLTGEAARRRVGELVRATPETPGYDVLEAFAREFADAVRAGDRAALIALHDMDADRLSNDQRRLLAYLLDDPDSPFAMLRAGDSTRPLRPSRCFIGTRRRTERCDLFLPDRRLRGKLADLEERRRKWSRTPLCVHVACAARLAAAPRRPGDANRARLAARAGAHRLPQSDSLIKPSVVFLWVSPQRA